MDIESVFKAYKSKIFALAISITRNQDDAKDVLQNTFNQAIRITHALQCKDISLELQSKIEGFLSVV